MAAKAHVRYPRRGEVYLVSFDPTLGAEIKKTRPGLILQNDIANRYSPITMVAATNSQRAAQLLAEAEANVLLFLQEHLPERFHSVPSKRPTEPASLGA